MIGYDIDGTLCKKPPKRDKPFFKQSGDERKEYEEIRLRHYRTAEVIRQPKSPYVVITGRKEKYRPETEAWFEENFDVQPLAIYMLQKSRTRENMIEFKISICKEHGISLFYEDDEKIARALADAGINVVKV